MITLSVKQPYATFICSGVKAIENRSWRTDFRGTVLIHSSGVGCDYFDYILPLPLWQEYKKLVKCPIYEISKIDEKNKYIGLKDHVFYLKDKNYVKEFQLLKTQIAEEIDNKSTLFLEHAIIGQVDLVDIVIDSDDKWSEPGSYHWILKNPVLYDKPINNVKGALRLWHYNDIVDTTPKIMIGG